MAMPSGFDKNLMGLGGSSTLSAAPGLVAGAQMVSFMSSLDGYKGSMAGALLEIAGKATIFQGRFIDDIFVLLFTRPAPAISRVSGLGLAGLGASLAFSGPALINGNKPKNLSALLPNFYSFVFRINPTTTSRTQTRARSTILTKGGYMTQYWSAGMKSMTFAGSSGSLTPPPGGDTGGGFNIRQTIQYSNFLSLRKFYEEANQDIGLFYLGRFVTGVMSDFNFTEDANNPYEIKYTFKFEAYPEPFEGG